MPNTDPILWPTQTTPLQGRKTYKFTGRKTLQLGKEKPYKPSRQNKKPQFAIFIYNSGPIGLWLRPILLRYLNSLETTTSFLSLFKARVYYILARPYQSITMCFIFHILTIPYILSLINHYYIRYTPPPPPPRLSKA